MNLEIYRNTENPATLLLATALPFNSDRSIIAILGFFKLTNHSIENRNKIFKSDLVNFFFFSSSSKLVVF